MESYSKIRRNIRKYKIRRWMGKRFSWLIAFASWVNKHTKGLQRAFKWLAQKFGFPEISECF